jgi:hypothetical protein
MNHLDPISLFNGFAAFGVVWAILAVLITAVEIAVMVWVLYWTAYWVTRAIKRANAAPQSLDSYHRPKNDLTRLIKDHSEAKR